MGACSKNNLGDLYAERGIIEGDPADFGFGQPDPNGAYGLLGLEAGSRIVEGAPELGAVYPDDGTQNVPVDTLVILRISESLSSSLASLATGFQVEAKAAPDLPVVGSYSFVEGSAHRLVVFEPTDPLDAQTEYEVTLTPALLDIQGNAISAAGTVSTFKTGNVGADVDFELIDALLLPRDDATQLSERTPVLAFFSEAVDRTSAEAGFTIKDQKNKAITGTVSFPTDYDDRLLLFTPTANMPAANRITVTFGQNIRNAALDETLGQQKTLFFSTLNIPHVTSLTIAAEDPLVALPASVYTGRVVESNQHALEVTLILDGAGRTNGIVLLFWDSQSKVITVVDEAKKKKGTYKYTIDLKPGDLDALQDGTIVVGAFTSDGNVNSPVAPAAGLPALLKDLVAPGLVSLGPPTGSGLNRGELLLEVPSAGVHGRASEALSSVELTVDVGGTPQSVEGLVFFSMEYPENSGIYSQEVTRGLDNLFITPPLTGVDVDLAHGSAPFAVTAMVLTDLAGNSTTISSPADTSVDYRGFVDSLAVATHELEVFCYDAVTLLPISTADVIIDQHSADYGSHSNDRLAAQTGTDGVAAFDNLSVLLPEAAVTITAVKDGYRLASILGLDKPVAGSGLYVSLPLLSEDNDMSAVTLFISESRGNPLPRVYVGGNRLISATNEVLFDAGDDPTDPLNPTLLAISRGKLQFFEGLGVASGIPEDLYQWAWSNPFLAETETAIQALLFSDSLMSTSQLTTQELETTSLSSSYQEVQARLVARLNGVTGTLPLGLDRFGQSIGGDQLTFTVPLPPSLFVDEKVSATVDVAAFDPPYELVIEPALGPVTYSAAPDLSLLEGALSFEIEEREKATDANWSITKRIPFVEAGLTAPRTVAFPADAGGAIELLADVSTPAVHPLEVSFEPVLTEIASQGVYRMAYRTATQTRHWTVSVPNQAYTDSTKTIRFPDLSAASLPAGYTPANSLTDFALPGAYLFEVEAFEVLGFDLHEAFLSTIERDWLTRWRSNLQSLTVTVF